MYELVVEDCAVNDDVVDTGHVVFFQFVGDVFENPVFFPEIFGVGNLIAEERVAGTYDYEGIATETDCSFVLEVRAEVL